MSKGAWRHCGCVLWTFQEKDDRDFGVATIWCEILREGQEKKILRGFVIYYEGNPLFMFSCSAVKF